MKHSKAKVLSLSLALLFGVIFATGCGPGVDIKIENHTDQVLTVHKALGRLGAPGRVGDIAPGDYIQLEDLRLRSTILFFARNDRDELVFYQEYSLQDLLDNDFTVIVLPILIGKDSSGNVTGDRSPAKD